MSSSDRNVSQYCLVKLLAVYKKIVFQIRGARLKIQNAHILLVCETEISVRFSPYLLERDQSYDIRRNANAAVHDCPVNALQDARVIRGQVHDAGQRSRRYCAAHDHGRDKADYD